MSKPRGTTIVEVVMALLLLMAAGSLVAQLAATIARQQRETLRQQQAIQVAHSALQQWLSLTPAQRAAGDWMEHLPGDPSRYTLQIEPLAQPRGARVTLRYQWNDREQEDRFLEMTAWSFAVEEQP